MMQFQYCDDVNHMHDPDSQFCFECNDKWIQQKVNNSAPLYEKGNLLLDLKQYEEAVKIFDQAISENNLFYDFHNYQGDALRNIIRNDLATQSYMDGFNFLKNNIPILKSKSLCLLHLGKKDEAIECDNEIVKIDKYQDQQAQGFCLFENDKFEEAFEFFKNEEENHNNLTSLHNMGFSLIPLEKYKQAMACFDKCISICYYFSVAYNSKGVVLSLLKQYNDAIKQFDYALKYDVYYHDVNKSKFLNNKGVSLFNLHQYEKAINCFEDSIQLDPQFSDAHLWKGNALQAKQNYKEALISYNNVIAINQRYFEAYFEKGNVLFSMKNFQQAIECYNNAIAIDPTSIMALNKKGIVLMEMTLIPKAIECFDQALLINSKDSVSYNNRGNALFKQQKHDEAIKCFNKALKCNPNLSQGYCNKGKVLVTQQKLLEAFPCFQKAIAIDSQCSEAYYYLGTILLSQGQYTKAVKKFNVAIKFNPFYFDAYCNKGSALLGLSKFDDALRCFDRAIKINQCDNSQKGQALNILINIIMLKGNYEDAEKCFDLAIKVNPQSFEDYNHKYKGLNQKGVALQAQQRYYEALECFDDAIKLNSLYYLAFENERVILSLEQNYPQAIKCFNEILKRNPNYDQAVIQKRNALCELQLKHKALKRQISEFPHDYFSNLELGYSLLQCDQKEEAFYCLQYSLKFKRNCQMFLFLMTIILFQMDKINEAQAVCRILYETGFDQQILEQLIMLSQY